MNPLPLDGWKTYLAAAGLLGLALYQFSTGEYMAAWQSLMAALAAFGLRQAAAKVQGEAAATRQAVVQVSAQAAHVQEQVAAQGRLTQATLAQMAAPAKADA